MQWAHGLLRQSFTNEDSQAAINYRAGSATNSLASNVLLVNTPQLAVSLAYFVLNSLLTRMLSAHEISYFAKHRKSLRVSRPVGEQRSTYWLQVPYRCGLPLMALTTLLHWLVSRAYYLVAVHVYDVWGGLVPDRAYIGHATSPLALLLACLLATALLFGFCFLAMTRLSPGMPVVGNCSVVVSAACHPLLVSGEDTTRLLMYGVITGSTSEQYGFNASEGRGLLVRTSFSLNQVEPLEVGKIYNRFVLDGKMVKGKQVRDAHA